MRSGDPTLDRAPAAASLSDVTERIALSLDPPQRLASVATLVAGGVAGRFGLSVERVGELQLVLSTVLEALDGTDDAVAIEFEVGDSLRCSLGPLGDDAAALVPLVRRLADGASIASRDGRPWLVIALDAPVAAAAD